MYLCSKLEGVNGRTDTEIRLYNVKVKYLQEKGPRLLAQDLVLPRLLHNITTRFLLDLNR